MSLEEQFKIANKSKLEHSASLSNENHKQNPLSSVQLQLQGPEINRSIFSDGDYGVCGHRENMQHGASI